MKALLTQVSPCEVKASFKFDKYISYSGLKQIFRPGNITRNNVLKMFLPELLPTSSFSVHSRLLQWRKLVLQDFFKVKKAYVSEFFWITIDANHPFF